MHNCYDIDKSFSSKKMAEDFVAKVGYGYIKEYILERTIPEQLKFSVIITDKMEYEVHYNNTDIAPNTICFTSTKSLCIDLMANDWKEAKEIARQKAAKLFNVIKNSSLKINCNKYYTVLDNGDVIEKEMCPGTFQSDFSDHELKEIERFLNIDEETYFNMLFEEKFPKYIKDFLTEEKQCAVWREPADSTFSFNEEQRQCLCIVELTDEKFINVPYNKWNLALKHITKHYSNFKEEQDKIVIYGEK